MNGCESWTIKKALYRAFLSSERSLRRHFRVPWTARRSNQLILNDNQSWIFTGRTNAEAETPILWPPDVKNWLWKRPWCWERLKARGEGDNRGWDGWMASLAWWIWVWVNSGSWWWTGRPGILLSMGSAKSCTWLCDWTELKVLCLLQSHLYID